MSPPPRERRANPAGPPSPRVRVRRGRELAGYDMSTLHAILDASPICHVGYVQNGQPVVTPTLCWRVGDDVYWHASSAGRMARDDDDGFEVCLTVTVVDGWVLARSAFHHTMNYRSVMLLGRAMRVRDPDEKSDRLRVFMERLFPGRWSLVRAPSSKELKATLLLCLRIAEASAKVRSGPPKDDPRDLDWPVWAGVIPLRNVESLAIPDAGNRSGALGAPPAAR